MKKKKKKQLQMNNQRARVKYPLLVPAIGVVVICEPQGTQQSHLQRYQDWQSLMGEVWLSGEVAAAVKHIWGGWTYEYKK